MSSSTLAAGIGQLRGRLAFCDRPAQSDEQLLHSFQHQHDDSAFAALVRRHGPMVLRVCRRVLGQEQDAEDAFQATFLVLARNVASLRNPAFLASYLHGTAYRTALKARQSAARRRKHEGQAATRTASDPAEQLSWREVQTLLDEEIARLPEIYRGVFILNCMENLSRSEIAQRLGLKERTVQKRLAEARQRLQKRLSRRGVELTAVLAATALTASSLPAGLTATTIKAASATMKGKGLAGLVSASVLALMGNSSPLGSKVKLALILLAVSLLAGGAVLAPQKAQPRGADPAPAAPAKRETDKGAVLAGRVLDPEGKPVKDARLYWPRFHKDLPDVEKRYELVERGQSDEAGRFRFPVPTGDDLDDPLCKLVVTAAGYGLNWIDVPKGKPSAELTLRLRKDVTIRGRIVSTEGKPLAGVKVRVGLLEEWADGRLNDYLASWGQNPSNVHGKTRWLSLPSNQSPVPAAVTDGNGRFQLSGAGSERIVNLALRGKDIAHASLQVVARSGFDPAALNKSARSRVAMGPGVRFEDPPVLYGPTFEYVASPGRIVEGVVREAGSGKPIPGVHISGGTGPRTQVGATTDKDGRYRLEGLPKVKHYPYLAAFPPPDSPWLSRVAPNTEAAEGLQPVRVDFTVARGVILKGRVIDRATGQGVACSLSYTYLPDNKFAGKPEYEPMLGYHASEKDGWFQVKVAPGTGVLQAVVMSLRESNPFKPAQFAAEDRKRITATADGGFAGLGGTFNSLSMLNAVKCMDLAPDAGVVEQDLYLERGATAKVRIQDAEGKPLSGTIVSGIDAIPALHVQEAYVAPQAESTIVALDPPQPRQVFFYHSQHRLAGTLTVRGDEKEPLTVRLAPTGTVTGCIKDAEGQPLQGAELSIGSFGLPMSPNLSYLYSHLNATGRPVRTDKEGRFRLEGVVASAKFTIGIRHRGAFLDGGPAMRGLQVKAGETLELGDVRIKPPQ